MVDIIVKIIFLKSIYSRFYSKNNIFILLEKI